MKLAAAKLLRNEITNTTGIYCTVPLGHGPTGYFCRIFTSRSRDCKTVNWGKPAIAVDFKSRRAWLSWKEKCDEARRIEKEQEAARRRLPAPKNALEFLIDQACGIR